MAITLASDSSSDAQITDGIGRGDLSAAARLWVRHWPTALDAARLYVERDEVPGLAAEALIGTISLTATGRGPREGVARFVTDMVRELGEEDGEVLDAGEPFPDVFVSPRLTSAFADLPVEDQHVLRTADPAGDEYAAALTVLQTSYLTTHLGEVPTRECRPAHIAMVAFAEGSAQHGFAGRHWLHLSTCAWCTEAFHEISFANVELPLLIAPGVWDVVIEPPPVEPPTEPPALASVENPDAVRHFDGETITIAAVTIPEPEPVSEPEDEERDSRGGLLATGRRRLIAAGVAAALIAGVALVLTQNGGSTSPTAAPAKIPTSSATTAEPGPTAGAEVDGTDQQEGLPSTSVEGPSLAPRSTATKAPAKAPTKAAGKPTPSSKPTRGPGTTPSAPATSTPPSSVPTPTPTPTATPTKRCNALQHLLGMC